MNRLTSPQANASHSFSSPQQARSDTSIGAPSRYPVTAEMARRINARRVKGRRAHEDRVTARKMGLLSQA